MRLLKLSLLGPPKIESNQQTIALSRRKVWALLAYLVCSPQRYRRDALATLLWPDLGQVVARDALRRDLYELTTALGNRCFLVDREHIGLDPDAPLEIDVNRFRRQLAPSVTAAPIANVQSAVALYAGDFLQGLSLPACAEFSEWQALEAENLRQTCAAALTRLVAWVEEQGAYDEAIGYGRRWLALDTMHEPAHRTLMRLFALAGQPTAAMRQYEECVRILQEDLAIEPTAETTALYTAIRARRFPTVDQAQPTTAPQPAAPTAPRAHLPTAGTPFIGRHDELAAITQLLCEEADCRLLTVIGPGGIGKTRIALQVAHQLDRRADQVPNAVGAKSDARHSPFPDGVYFAALAAVSEPDQLFSAIADAVGCHFRGSETPQHQLENFLRPLRLLLVLDNFEHVLDGRQYVAALLAAAAELSILVTSREALDLPAEWLYPLGGLPTPDPDVPWRELTHNTAVQLFVQRAQRVARDFTVDATNAPTIVQICRLVDGMPLGLELAASWLHTLTVTELAEEIASNLDILATELRNIPERHRSLRAVFEQTWQRLHPVERQTLCRLSVFRGTFTREAAAAVAQASLANISALVDRALCRHQADGYDIHELLRQFAGERLDAAALATMRAQHSDYFGRLVASQHQQLLSAKEEEALQVVAAIYDNLMAAWHHMLAQLAAGNEAERWGTRVRELVPVLAAYFDRRALFWEGERIFRNACEQLHPTAAMSPTVQVHLQRLMLHLQIEQAGLGMHLGNYQEATTALTALLPDLREQEAHPYLVTALLYLGLAYIRMGDYGAAEACTDEVIVLCQDDTRRGERAAALINRGVIANSCFEYAAARTAFQEAAQIFAATGYATGQARCINNIGSTYVGDPDKIRTAMAHYEEAYQIASRQNSRLWAGIAICNLGFCDYELGNYDKACARYETGLAIFRELRDMRWVTVTLADVSYALIARGLVATARTYLYESLRLVQQYQLVIDGLKALAATAMVLEEQQAYSTAVALATHVLDDARTRSTARNCCIQLLATVADRMPQEAYADAQFHGRSTPFPLMVQLALECLT